MQKSYKGMVFYDIELAIGLNKRLFGSSERVTNC